MSKVKLCFARALVSFVCTGDHCKETQADAPGRRYFLTFFGFRTTYAAVSLRYVRRRFAKCLGIELKAKATPDAASVILAYRSRADRKFEYFNTRLPPLVKQINETLHPKSITLYEVGRVSPNEIIGAFLNADLVMGPWGHSLTWVGLMPPSSVLFEVTGGNHGCPTWLSIGNEGFLKFALPGHWRDKPAGFFRRGWCEYLGMALVVGVRTYSLVTEPERPEGLPVSALMWRKMTHSAACALRWEVNQTYSTMPLYREWNEVLSDAYLRSTFADLINTCA